MVFALYWFLLIQKGWVLGIFVMAPTVA
jgi:hypothetical protein